MKTTTNYQFGQNPKINMPRSSFDRSHGVKTTFDAGQLIPVFQDEVLPGDTFTVKTSGFLRLATPIYPIMDNMFADMHYFFVPNRLLWDNWQKFMGEKDDPSDTTEYLVPTATFASQVNIGSIWDYLGYPTEVTGFDANVLPWRAYRAIFDDWYRDQNFQPKILTSKGDGVGTVVGNQEPFRRNKRHDYFTSCLPWPQKGEDTTIPLGVINSAGSSPERYYYEGEGTGVLTNIRNTVSTQNAYFGPDTGASERVNPIGGTINELRTAFQLQEFYEKDARGGTRYTEVILSHFGVQSPDQRLQRPEFLGGGTAFVNVTPVANTAPSATTGDTQVRNTGDLGAMGTCSFQDIGFTKSFTEHGLIMGIISVRADYTYQNRLDRSHTRRDKLDYYWPSFAHLGEQAVLNQELNCHLSGVGNEDVFGYNERYSEYRWKPSSVHGQFKSSYTDTLDAWHLANDYGPQIVPLNEFFISETPPVDRVVATPDEPHFLADFYHQVRAARPIPVYGTPRSLGRF